MELMGEADKQVQRDLVVSVAVFLQEFVMMPMIITSQNYQMQKSKRNHHQVLQFLCLTSLSTHKFRACNKGLIELSY